MRREWPAPLLIVLLPLLDLLWNLAHLNIGLVDFYGLSAFAAGFAKHGAWPATPYFPAGYPLLLIPFGYAGSTLIGGYVLSAIGIMLALLSAWLLLRHYGACTYTSFAAAALCWMLPVCRVVSGSPSVDALYSGVGLLFLASAIAAWSSAQPTTPTRKALPGWAITGLATGAVVLPLLRYHAIILLVPVLLVLLLSRVSKRLVLTALLLTAGTVCFNYISYFAAYAEPLQSAAALQIATGLELRYHILYPLPGQSLWDAYPEFCERVRQTKITDLFTPVQMGVAWLSNWAMFLRQPSVLLLFVYICIAAALRRQLPRGPALGLLWIITYTLALSCTYYTARAALLPVMLSVPLCLIVIHRCTSQRCHLAAVTVASVLLFVGILVSNQFAASDRAQRIQWAANSRYLDQFIAQRQITHASVVVQDWRLLPLTANPWTAPYVTLSGSWLDDLAIRAWQVETVQSMSATQLLEPDPPVDFVVLDATNETAVPLSAALLGWSATSANWQEVDRVGDLIIYSCKPGPNPAGGAGQMQP